VPEGHVGVAQHHPPDNELPGGQVPLETQKLFDVPIVVVFVKPDGHLDSFDGIMQCTPSIDISLPGGHAAFCISQRDFFNEPPGGHVILATQYFPCSFVPLGQETSAGPKSQLPFAITLAFGGQIPGVTTKHVPFIKVEPCWQLEAAAAA
jgi:hypothetical protein